MMWDYVLFTNNNIALIIQTFECALNLDMRKLEEVTQVNSLYLKTSVECKILMDNINILVIENVGTQLSKL